VIKLYISYDYQLLLYVGGDATAAVDEITTHALNY